MLSNHPVVHCMHLLKKKYSTRIIKTERDITSRHRGELSTRQCTAYSQCVLYCINSISQNYLITTDDHIAPLQFYCRQFATQAIPACQAVLKSRRNFSSNYYRIENKQELMNCKTYLLHTLYWNPWLSIRRHCHNSLTQLWAVGRTEVSVWAPYTRFIDVNYLICVSNH